MHPPPSSRRPGLRGLADVLEPEAPAPDFAFAPTVHAADFDDPIPPSNPMIVRDAFGNGQQCMTPLAFPLPPPSEDASLATKARGTLAQVRHAWLGQLQELAELWRGTAESGSLANRLRALWSCWQWDRTDIARAAIIGMSVFVVVATIGASVAAAGVPDDSVLHVRAPRTLDQHTGKSWVIHGKR